MRTTSLFLLLTALLALYPRCSDETDQVLDAPVTAQFAALSGVYVSNRQTINRYALDSDETEQVYATDSGVCIASFDVHAPTNALIVVTDQHSAQYAETNRHTNRIVKISSGGVSTLYEKTTQGWESLESLDRVCVAPNGAAAAVEVSHCSYGGIATLEFGSDTLIHNRGEAGMDDCEILFLVWDPGSLVFFARFLGALVRCDAYGGTNEFLPSPNIRDYLSTDALLAQGYLGDRFDFEPLIGIAEPRLVYWSPRGDRFVYLQADSVYLYDRSTHSRRFICAPGVSKAPQRHLCVVWGEHDQPPPYDTAAFTDNDLLFGFDSTVLDTVMPMNSSYVEYQIGRSFDCVSTVSMDEADCWRETHPYRQYRTYGFNTYVLHRPIDTSVFTMLETTFLIKFFGMLCNRGATEHPDTTQIQQNAVLAAYDSILVESESFHAQFRACTVDEVFRGIVDAADMRMTDVIRYYHSRRELWATRDTAIFADSLYAIFGDQNSARIDTILHAFHEQIITLDYSQALAETHRRIHNQFLNVLGWDETREITQALVENGIEPFAAF